MGSRHRVRFLALASLSLCSLAVTLFFGRAVEAKPWPSDGCGEVVLAPGESVTLGALLELGGFPEFGIDSQRGIELAIDARGGKLLGRSIALLVEDGGCNPRLARTAAHRFAAPGRPPVVGVVGTNCSGAAMAANDILGPAGIQMVSPSNTSPDLRGRPFYASVAINDAWQGEAMAERWTGRVGHVAILDDGGAYSMALAKAFDARATANGMVTSRWTFNVEFDRDFFILQSTLDEISSRMKDFAAEGVDSIYFPVFVSENALITAFARKVLGAGVLLGSGDSSMDGEFLHYVDSYATDYAHYSGAAAEGVELTGANWDFRTSLAYLQFVDAYVKKYGEGPIMDYHAHAYDAANLILDAVANVARTDGSGVTRISRCAIRDRILGGEAHAGLTGDLECDASGDCAERVIDVFEVEQAQFTKVGTVEL